MLKEWTQWLVKLFKLVPDTFCWLLLRKKKLTEGQIYLSSILDISVLLWGEGNEYIRWRIYSSFILWDTKVFYRTTDEYVRHYWSHTPWLKISFLKPIESEKSHGIGVHGAKVPPSWGKTAENTSVANVLMPNFNCCNTFLSSWVDKVTTGTYSFILVIANAVVWFAAALDITQLLDKVRLRLMSQLINGISRVLLKLLKDLNDTIISTFLVLSPLALLVIFCLNLNEAILQWKLLITSSSFKDG